MDFIRVLSEVTAALDRAGVHFALIGGFGMAMRGVQRATVGLDFILYADDLDKAHAIFEAFGYERVFTSENVSHYRGQDDAWGRIDILHAFRRPSLSMLSRAQRLEVSPQVEVPVARVEDIIGLKIQAAFNDATRADRDWLDIRHLLQAAAAGGQSVDWALLGEYLDIFEMGGRLDELRSWYEQAE